MKRLILLLLLVLSITACSNKSAAPQVSEVKNKIYAVNNEQESIENSAAITKQESIDSHKAVKIPRAPAIVIPVNKNKVIVIDPGHANKSNLQTEALYPGASVTKIKDGGGAEGIVTRTPEYLVNMRVSIKLRDILQQRGYTVIMTKTDNSLSMGNIERAEVGNKANAALVIRIHADSSNNTSVKGASMLVPKAINTNTKAIYAESLSCGTAIINTLTKEVGMANRGVTIHDDMTGFNWSKVPVILVEMGFLSNPAEDRLLCTDAYENKLAKGLADGISNSA